MDRIHNLFGDQPILSMWNASWDTIEPVLHWLGFLSLCTFFISLAVIPWLISRLPLDYFTRHASSPTLSKTRLPFRGPFWFVLRNLVGSVLLLAGFAMLFLPGQGILTIIIGISLLTFPGKHRLLSTLTRRPSVQKALDWIRIKTCRQSFIWPKKIPPASTPKTRQQ